jgi:hypothetical protein
MIIRALSATSILTAAVLLPAAAEASSAGDLVQASGVSPFAACTVGGPGTNYPDAEVEPFLAVNPANSSNLIGVFQQDRWSNGGAHGLVTVSSTDAGATWTQSWPHFSTCAGGTEANGGAYDRSSDPWVSIGPDGTAYQVSLSVNTAQTISAILASTSTDGGATWSEPATIQRDDSPNHFVFNDKESVTADPYHAGVAYVVWDRSRFPSDSANVNAGHSYAFRGDPMFSKTTDGGLTWSAPRIIAHPQNKNLFTIGNQIAVEPDGTLIDVYHFGKGSGFDAPNASFTGVQRSTDGGLTWSAPIVVSTNPVVLDVDPDTGAPLRTGADIGGAIPDVAVDPRNGALYLVWEDSRFSGTHDDIALSKSTDEGRTWTTPVKVNQSPLGVTAFTPSVDILPNGTVGVTYYDLRNNTPAAGLPTDYFFVSSGDGAATWQPEARVTPTSFNMENAPFARGYFLGDYEGLAHSPGVFYTLFIKTTDSIANRTDAFATTLTP